jgi:hypothetical protein
VIRGCGVGAAKPAGAAMDGGASERAELFQLLPRLLRILPASSTHEPLAALYPALVAAAAHDPLLSALAALSPLLAHVIAAALAHPTPAARDAATVLLHALALRPAVSPAAGALVLDLSVTLARLPQDQRPADDGTTVCGRLPILIEFGKSAVSVDDVFAASESPRKGSAIGEAAAWPGTPITVKCNAETRKATIDLLKRFVYSPVWLRLGPILRNSIVRQCLESGDRSLLLAFKNARKSAVPLSRPLVVAIDAALTYLTTQEGGEDNMLPISSQSHAEDSVQAPRPRKRPRHGIEFDRSSTDQNSPPVRPTEVLLSRLQFDLSSQLRAVSTVECGPTICVHLARLCERVSLLRKADHFVDGLIALRALAVDCGTAMLEAAVGKSDDGSFVNGALATVVGNLRHLEGVFELAAAVLEVAAMAEIERLTEPDSDINMTLTASRVVSSQSTAACRRTSCKLKLPSCLPRVAFAVLAALYLVSPFMSKLTENADEAARLLARGSMLLWRLSDVVAVSSLSADVQPQAISIPISETNGADVAGYLAIQNQLSEVSTQFKSVALDALPVKCMAAQGAALRASSRVLAMSSSAVAAADAENIASCLAELICERRSDEHANDLVVGALYALFVHQHHVSIAYLRKMIASQCKNWIILRHAEQVYPCGLYAMNL